jgi:Ca-activated chloride channel family protein
VGTLTALADLVARALREWWALSLADLQFAELSAAQLCALAALGAGVAAFLLRILLTRRGPLRRAQRGIALPALPSFVASSRTAWVRHGALVVALAGIPFFVLALADPRTAFTRDEASYPGRRISLMIDASSSMLQALQSPTLARGAPNSAAFFTTVGAARYFVELRMRGQYRDLVSLIEFGDDAYVITPFTSDYENILLSISLIGDWNEFMAFPDQGTVIARAIDQGVGLFKAFDFLDHAGNLMVIFTDGADSEVMSDGRTAFDVLREAQRAKIPVYFLRTAADAAVKRSVTDDTWRDAVARTGGRFYAATDEATIVRAMHEIDRASAGRITMQHYATQIPRFSPFAVMAVACWTLGLAMRFTLPWFEVLS